MIVGLSLRKFSRLGASVSIHSHPPSPQLTIQIRIDRLLNKGHQRCNNRPARCLRAVR